MIGVIVRQYIYVRFFSRFPCDSQLFPSKKLRKVILTYTYLTKRYSVHSRTRAAHIHTHPFSQLGEGGNSRLRVFWGMMMGERARHFPPAGSSLFQCLPHFASKERRRKNRKKKRETERGHFDVLFTRSLCFGHVKTYIVSLKALQAN